MERPVTCSGCFSHTGVEVCGIIIYPVIYGPGHKTARAQPRPTPFPDGRTAKFACEECWECWELFASSTGYDEPDFPEDVEGILNLRNCAICSGIVSYDVYGVIIFPVVYRLGKKSGQAIPIPERWSDGMVAKFVCTDCWQSWEMLEDNTGYMMTDPSTLLEAA